MFKLVVLSVLLVVVAAAPKPGYLHSAPIAYAAPLAIPTAVSHSSRIDIHSKPLITTYAAPLVTSHLVASPILKSYDYGLVGDYGLGYGNGYGYGGYGYGSGYGHGLHGLQAW